ncbi:ATP-grasp domain-containing protein [Enterobacter ludwigii]|uniref:ATP-grasp domain-containing protein n=1 Tax=Enterobacter ludwigii TaxID=299767 RepID=UPI003F6E511A
MGNKIGFIGSGKLLLDRAKSFGLYVVLIQKQSLASMEAIALADSVLLCDYDVDDNKKMILDFLREQDIEKVLTLSEKALSAAAWINDELSRENKNSVVAEIVKNKILMRDKLRETPYGNVNYHAVYSTNDLSQAATLLGFPFILKPSRGVGSENVQLVVDNNQLTTVNVQQTLIAEQYIGGKEYSVEAFSVNGVHTVHAVTEKSLFNNEGSRFVEHGHIVSRENNDGPFFAAIDDFVCGFLSLIGIESGATHTEVKVDRSAIHIIESHNRVGGDSIPELVYHATGVDLYSLAIQEASGLLLDNTRQPVSNNSGILFFDFVPGQVSGICGEQRVKLLPYVKDVSLPHLTNVSLSRPVDSFSRNGYVICSTPEDVKSKLDLCQTLINPIYL